MIRIRDESVVQQWIYKNPEDGFVISHFGDFPAISAKVKAYRRINSFPVGSNFSEQLVANLCQNLPNACIDAEEISLAQKAITVSRAMYNWSRAGFPTRSQEEVQHILEICRDCSHYAGESGIFKIVCKLCGCSRKKLALKTEICPANPPKWT